MRFCVKNGADLGVEGLWTPKQESKHEEKVKYTPYKHEFLMRLMRMAIFNDTEGFRPSFHILKANKFI